MSPNAELTPVQRIFKRLAATYGAAWDRSLGQVPIADVMTAWEHELAGFLQNKRTMLAIAWALENLPERCPNVIEFRALCRSAPSAPVPVLPAPAADPARMAEALATLAPVRKAVRAGAVASGKGWAQKLIEKHERGEFVNVGPLRTAREALGLGGRYGAA